MPLNELPFEWLSKISFFNLVYENHLITIYGSERCPSDQMQFTLFMMGLNQGSPMNRPLGGGYREGVSREGGIGGVRHRKKIEKIRFKAVFALI